MNPLIILEKDEATPAITLDNVKGVFEIKGWSHPEDAIGFYVPVIEWMKHYAENPNAETLFHFHLQYYNSASAKQLFKLIALLDAVAKKSKTKIYWHHDGADADALSSGENFSKTSTVPFEFVSP